MAKTKGNPKIKTASITCVVNEDDHKRLIELIPLNTTALNFSHWLRLAEKREINKIERKIEYFN